MEVAKTPLDTAMENWAVEQLLPKLNNRMGNVLFVRACLPEVAIRLVNQGLFVTVVEHDPERLERFMAPIRAEKLDRKVSVDARGYDGIEYQASSYNVVLCWEGVPNGMEPALFFKKVRRELKAGSNLYIRIPLRPVVALPERVLTPLRTLAAKLPPKLSQRLDGLLEQMTGKLALPEAVSLAEFQEASAAFLKFEQSIPLSIVAERLRLLPKEQQVMQRMPAGVLQAVLNLDRKLLASARNAGLASSSLLVFSKSLEFGKVFRV